MAILTYSPEFITYWKGHSFAIEAPTEFSVEKNTAGTDLCNVIVEDEFSTIGSFDVLVDGTSIGEINTVSGLTTIIGKEHPILLNDTLTIVGDLTIIASFKSNGNIYTSLIINSAAGTISYSDGSTTTVAYTDNPTEGEANWTNEAFRYITPQNEITATSFGILITNHYGDYCGYCLPVDISTLSGWNSLSDGFHRVQFKYKEANTKYLVLIDKKLQAEVGWVAEALEPLFNGESYSEFRYGIGYKVVTEDINVAIDITNASEAVINQLKLNLEGIEVGYKEYNHPKTKISSEVLVGKNTVFQPHVITQSSYLVSDVVDGDTIKVDFGSGVIQKVRLIGVDTPESVATGTMAKKNCPEGTYVSNLTKQLKGTYVYLEFDEEIYDQFNRYLAYIHLDNTGTNMYNNKLALEGYAQAKYYAPNGYHRELLEGSMAIAEGTNAGFWGTSIQYPGYAFYPNKIKAISDLTINNGIISWTKSVWASSYKIHIGSQDLAVVNQPESGTTVSYDLNGLELTAGQTYDVKVRVISKSTDGNHEDSNLSNAVQFTPIDYSTIPFYVTSDEDFFVSYSLYNSLTSSDVDIYYKHGDAAWVNWVKWDGTSVRVNAGTKFYLKNTKTSLSKSLENYLKLEGTFKKAAGNIKYMVGESTSLPEYALCRLFNEITSLQYINNLILPWTTLSPGCYHNMFMNCTSLISCPKLPATTLAQYCYRNMFYGCIALTKLPALVATKLEKSCYVDMFASCSNIKLSTVQTGEYINSYRIPITGEGTIGSISLGLMFDKTGGTFTGSPTINTTYYTSNEVIQ